MLRKSSSAGFWEFIRNSLRNADWLRLDHALDELRSRQWLPAANAKRDFSRWGRGRRRRRLRSTRRARGARRGRERDRKLHVARLARLQMNALDSAKLADRIRR
jgi:hypothetical protein